MLSDRRSALLILILLGLFSAAAQSQPTLKEQILRLTSRPEFKHSQFGIEIYDLRSGKAIFSLNGDKLFIPGSTTKLLTEGTVLALLGPDYRFHTRIYRSGPITQDGTLHGDLILRAAGDPNLSARVRPDGTLAYTSNDHTYAGALYGIAVPGDPLIVFKKLAQQVAESGIKRIEGHVMVDTSLFSADVPEPGTRAMISPIIVNDNLVDVTVTPGPREGSPTSISASPFLPYVNFINKTQTGSPRSNPEVLFTSDVTNSDETHTVTVQGTVPVGDPWLAAYKVKTPVRYAEFAFIVALQTAGIQAQVPPARQQRDSKALAAWYRPENLVAEYVSPPLKAEVKVTLKASQNLHAATMPYLLGATVTHDPEHALQAGLNLEREFLAKAGLDLTAASQADGVGGPGAAFTPDFMVHYLAYIARQPYAHAFIDALPIMGKDGTLEGLQEASPAAGHVRAKSGTYVFYDGLNRRLLLLGKGLVGYIDTRHGRKLAFAAFVNNVPVANMDEVEKAGDALGEIATAAYEAKLP